MRHQKSGRKFSRTSAHRKAMFSNMVASLVIHGKIETTVPKAKELRRLADRTISWGTSVASLTAKGRDKLSTAEKAKVVHAMRMAGRVIRSSEALHKLFGEVAPQFADRAGGYTRLLKTRTRLGDAAPMSIVALVGSEVVAKEEPKAPSEKKAAEGKKKPAKAAKKSAEKSA
jgi:large subunit ribosomal protein L17